MAFIGSTAFTAYDRTEQQSGAAPPGRTRPQSGQFAIDLDFADNAPSRTGIFRQESNRISRIETEPDDDSELEQERRASIVQELARRYTSHASYNPGTNPFLDTAQDSPLNPHSEKFNARAWAKAFVSMSEGSGQHFRSAGVCFQNLNVHGFGQATDFQKSVGNYPLEVLGTCRKLFGLDKPTKIDILRNFDGLVRKGEMLVVLGPPGSGCSTFLKTLSGETNGIFIDDNSYFNYQGISAKEMHTQHRGEAIYTAEVDVHYPRLSVGDALYFAARARAPRNLPDGVDSDTYAKHLRDTTMAMFGISHTINTRVGNEYVRGVSGGERKRVTISEAALSRAPLQCWDNSTRGLDSANAVEFCKTLRTQTELFGTTACVSIYQAPQNAYNCFDKALVIYEGRQIYFGPANAGKQYFEKLGFECPARQTVPDFLTSMTSPKERVVRAGYKDRVPRTPDDFARAWQDSEERQVLLAEIEAYKLEHPFDGADADAFRQSKRAQQSKHQRLKSPYTLSYTEQVRLCLWRSWQTLRGDPSLVLGMLISHFFLALIIASVFYNINMETTSFFQRGALLFVACLMNAFASALEILSLWAQRPIIEKHNRYALYHPSAESIASMIMDLPYKVLNCICFNLTLYFMSNLRREAGAFFFFLFLSFVSVLMMSMVFRTIASASRTLSQAMVPAALLLLDLIIFTGFIIPVAYMPGWCRWLNYVDPLAYAFESFMVNEFSGRQYHCNQFVPSPKISGYQNVPSEYRSCRAVGSVAGEAYVDGDRYIAVAFQYYAKNKWRNVGILIAFLVFFLGTYLVSAELVREKKSKGEVLVFQRGHKPGQFKERTGDPEEGPRVGPVVTNASNAHAQNAANIQSSESVFHWSNVCYDVKIKSETRRILDHVDGWVKPGTLTALMGVSGAGKTTLLDALASRVTMGVITGEMMVDGRPRDSSFQRKTGYVQQQDLHLSTTTVREALEFSALLRQPESVPREEKLAYVDEVIKLLEMEEYADAVTGVLGEGLNVEQRKRLTIGVELAAKPPLLLFVDEPTSGLDSQTSWSILDLLEKLTKNGQAVLCTIHQPSAMLFQRFDRLLFLAKGGKTVYFGEVGENSKVLTKYFESHGAPACPPDANPAEWMLDAIGAAPGSHTDIDWHQTWRESKEFRVVQRELQRLKDEAPAEGPTTLDDGTYREHAAPFWQQLQLVTHRVFQQYWRTPSYIYAKTSLCILVALFIGLVFINAPNTQQGLQNQMFAIFNIFTVFGQLVQQTMPHFVTQRALYEVRERPSKTYSWPVFMLSQIIAELPWNSLMAVFMFTLWYYPVGLQKNAALTDATAERGALAFLFIWAFLIFTCTFTDMIIAAFDTAEGGGHVANLIFSLSLIFCGVLAAPSTLPGFWMFMYRVSPFTYLSAGLLAVSVGNTPVECAENEFNHFNPPPNTTCGDFLKDYIPKAGGFLRNPEATTDCTFCHITEANEYLADLEIYYDQRWRNFGLMFAYIIANIVGALFFYWLARMPKGSRSADKLQPTPTSDKTAAATAAIMNGESRTPPVADKETGEKREESSDSSKTAM